MEKLVFRTFTWPQNPDKLQHSYVREPVYTKDVEGNAVFSGMGAGKCTITGSGAFFGDGAYDSFRALMALFEEGACGDLKDPTWGAYTVYLTELELTQEPKSDYVAYRFTFTRADADGAIPQ